MIKLLFYAILETLIAFMLITITILLYKNYKKPTTNYKKTTEAPPDISAPQLEQKLKTIRFKKKEMISTFLTETTCFKTPTLDDTAEPPTKAGGSTGRGLIYSTKGQTLRLK